MRRVAPALTAAALLALAGTAGADEPGPPQELPAGAGRPILERACAQCHALEVITRQRRTLAQWDGTIDMMLAKGAKLSDEEIDVLAAYLAEHFGRAATN